MSSIKIALDANLSFYLFKGDPSLILKEIQIFFKETEAYISYLEGEEFSVENTKALVSKLNVQSSNLQVFLIKNFDSISIQSQNILLKIIENLGENKILIGICKDFDSILDTIMSRAYYLYTSTKEAEMDLEANPSKDILKKIELNQIGTFNAYRELSKHLDSNSVKDILDQEEVSFQRLSFINNALHYFKRIEANCNNELCLDLLIYRTLEEK